MKSRTRSKVLVTGATGFLGRRLVEHLLENGDKNVRVLTTSPPEWLQETAVEIIEGSILSPEIVRVAVEDAKSIYHLAGRVSRKKDDQRKMYAIHVDGTRILCEAALTAGVHRMVLVSSSGTIAISEDGYEIPDETWPTPLEIITKFPYYSSKLYQEKTARTICADRLELVIVNPSLLLGPGDARLSSTEDVLKFLAGDIPAVPSGGINFVDVRDVAPAVHNAMLHGTPGERYLMGGPNWTLERFFGHLERLSQVSAPRFKIGKRLHSASSTILEAAYKTIGKTPPLDPISMEMSRYFWYCNSGKAARELDFISRDPGETLFDTVQYLRERFLGKGVFE